MKASAGVAVVVPVYNANPYLGDLISSLRSQDYRGPKVVIFVDDGSSDSSRSILEDAQIDGWKKTVLSQPNRGQSAARNLALRSLLGETDSVSKYVIFLDADDMLAPDALSAAVNVMEKDGLDELFFTGSSFFESEALRQEFSRYKTYYERNKRYKGVYSGSRYMLESWRGGDWYPSPCMQMVRLSFLVDSGIAFEEGIIHEDNLYTWSCLLNAKRVSFLDKPLYLRRIREGSTMTKPTRAENALGYFRCGVRAYDFSEQVASLGAAERDAFIEVVDSWFATASDQWLAFEDEEKKRLDNLLSGSDLIAFRELVVRRAELRAGCNTAVRDAEARGYATGVNDEHERVLKSPSFKLGRALTAIPRKLLGR